MTNINDKAVAQASKTGTNVFLNVQYQEFLIRKEDTRSSCANKTNFVMYKRNAYTGECENTGVSVNLNDISSCPFSKWLEHFKNVGLMHRGGLQLFKSQTALLIVAAYSILGNEEAESLLRGSVHIVVDNLSDAYCDVIVKPHRLCIAL